jgi:hypothetical protein
MQKEQKIITTNLLTELNKIAYAYRPVSVGESFLFLFNASKLHHKSVKRITNYFGCVLIDIKNPTQLTTLKKVEHSSNNWSTKFSSSMASLHKNGFKLHKLINIIPI